MRRWLQSCSSKQKSKLLSVGDQHSLNFVTNTSDNNDSFDDNCDYKTDATNENNETETDNPDELEQPEQSTHEALKPSEKKRKLWKPKLNPATLISQFAWIDESKKIPTCKVCNKEVTGGLFHIKRHAKTSNHIRKYNAIKKTPCIESSFVDNKTVNSVKRAELKFAAYVCDHNLPFLVMDSLPTLCKNIFPDSKIAKDVKMKRNKTTDLVVETIAPFFKSQIIADLKSNTFTLIIDETTDISIKKSLIVLVRYWKHDRVVDRILELIEVEDASAEALFLSIKSILDTHSVPYKNMIAFAADNASTMMGDKNGVQAKLRELVPNLYVQGCLCHSLHLCSSAAAKELPSVVEQFVRDIYAYFAHSSKRISELGECQIFANEKPHKMLYPSQTRWLSLKVSSF